MPDNEDKKTLSSIGVIKKTEKIIQKEEEQIGVEADIPVDGDEITNSDSLAEGLKLNENISAARTEEKEPEIEIKPKESKVQVFNISSGKIIQKNIIDDEKPAETVINDNEQKAKPDLSSLPSVKKTRPAFESNDKKSINKNFMIIVGVILVILVFLLIFVFKGFSSNQKKEEIQSPAINLSK